VNFKVVNPMNELLRQIEIDHGLSFQQMAEKLGISKSYYSMLKNGTRPISKNIALIINREFKVPLEELLLRPQVHISKTDKPTGTEG
jgi:transcriptional regulator with XRE-family HTH domain